MNASSIGIIKYFVLIPNKLHISTKNYDRDKDGYVDALLSMLKVTSSSILVMIVDDFIIC